MLDGFIAEAEDLGKKKKPAAKKGAANKKGKSDDIGKDDVESNKVKPAVDEKKVYVTSLMLNKIFSIDLFSEEVKTFSHKLKEPAGIAIDPKNGTIFVSCRASKTVESFNSDMCYLGQFLLYQVKVPIGLCVHDENIYVSTNENSAIMKVPIKYGN